MDNQKSQNSGSKNFFVDLKEALAGSERDYTEIPLRKAVFFLAIPMVLEMIMESVFAVIDIFFVSKLGADAVAAVGITESVLTLVYAIAFGLSMATTAIVSRRIGEKHPKEASVEAWQAILTGLFAALVLSIPGALLAKPMLQLMGASPAVVEEFSIYTILMFGSNMVIMLLFINNAIFRGAGDAAIAMKVLVMGNIINIILDPILIFGLGPIPAMGIAGAATATIIGRGLAVIFQFYILFKGTSRINLKEISHRPDRKKILHLLKISLGGIAQSIIATSSWIFMMRLITRYGSHVVAGYTIAIRIVIFALLPSWGLSNAASTLTGQNLGAGKPERAESAVWKVGWINFFVLGIIGLLFAMYPHAFIRLFTADEAIINSGAISLRIVSYGFAFYGLGMVMVQAFNGAGDTRTPTYINIIAFWLIEIPLAWALSMPLGQQEQGVYYGIIIAESSLTILAAILFKQGRWKKEIV
jgi:putative MATE family efflux protein